MPNTLIRTYRDLWNGFQRYQLWHHLAASEIKLRYRQTLIGPLWFPLSILIFSGGLSLVFAEFFDQRFERYFPYVALGLTVWGLMSRIIVESCRAFTAYGGIIHQIKAPLSIHIYRLIYRNLLIFLHEFSVVYVLIAILQGGIDFVGILYFAAGIALLLLNGFCIAIIFAIICARFRDLTHIVDLTMRFMFFMTPVFWLLGKNTWRDQLTYFNPLFHALEITRGSLLDIETTSDSWLIMLASLAVLFPVALGLFWRYRRLVPMWI